MWVGVGLATPTASLHVEAAPCKLVVGQVLNNKDESSYLAILHDGEARLTMRTSATQLQNLLPPSCPQRSIRAPKVERETDKQKAEVPKERARRITAAVSPAPDPSKVGGEPLVLQ